MSSRSAASYAVSRRQSFAALHTNHLPTACCFLTAEGSVAMRCSILCLHALRKSHPTSWHVHSTRGAGALQVMDPSGGHAEPAAFVQLLQAAGADTEHCSEAWVANHYRWIVWKLACYERRLPQQLAGRMLTVPIVLDQLKYRCSIIVKALSAIVGEWERIKWLPECRWCLHGILACLRS